MNLTDLDEWQGLTSDMVQQWAEGHGYQYRVSGLVKGGYVSFANPLRPDAIGWLVPLLADRAKLSPQAFLREINPRMRKGMPSQAARAAHAGPWVGHMGGEFPLVTIGHWGDDGSFTAGLMLWDARKVAEAAEAKYPCAFWPCDEHGAKVRWLEENGAML